MEISDMANMYKMNYSYQYEYHIRYQAKQQEHGYMFQTYLPSLSNMYWWFCHLSFKELVKIREQSEDSFEHNIWIFFLNNIKKGGVETSKKSNNFKSMLFPVKYKTLWVCG